MQRRTGKEPDEIMEGIASYRDRSSRGRMDESISAPMRGMEGSGGRWREMEGSGGRWREMEGSEGKWREMERGKSDEHGLYVVSLRPIFFTPLSSPPE